MIKWIIIALIALVALGAMGYNVKDAIEAPATKSNLQYAKELSMMVWDKFLSKPVKFIWEPVIQKIGDKLGAEEFRTMKLNTASSQMNE
jgi:hypothetical protein